MPAGHPQFTRSGPETTRPRKRSSSTASTSNVPGSLQNTIPTCAQNCLSAYIGQEYACSTNNASCLCQEYSSQGFTLGELAFLCVRLDCPDATTKQEADAYNVCSARSNAVLPTHSTLTLPAASSTPTQTLTTTTTTTSPSATGRALSSSTAPASTQSTATPSETFSSIQSSTASTTPAKSGGSSAVTSAQAIGISIAAIGSVIIAITIAYIIICMRRRQVKSLKGGRHSYDFVDKEAPRFSPFNYGSVDPRGPLGGFHHPRVELPSEKHKTAWPSQYLQTIRPVQSSEQVGEHNHYGEASGLHASLDEVRVPSQLLPERPGSQPPRPPPKSPIDFPQTPATVFEEERPEPLPTALLPGLPAHPAVHKTRLLPTQPVLSLSIPGQARSTDAAQPTFSLPAPPAFANRSSSRSNAHSSKSSLLDYYADCDSGSTEDLYSATPIDRETQVRRPPPAAILVSGPTHPPRAVRVSTASTDSRRTSFESTDPDEPTPPDEDDKRLTPVAESPIAAIRYPKIPRSSNQTVPRSPGRLSPRPAAEVEEPQQKLPRYARRTDEAYPATPEHPRPKGHTPTLSGTTLAAKRRGDNAAQALEHGIHISDSAHAYNRRKNTSRTSNSPKSGQEFRPYRLESPLKGYGRVASRQQPNWPLAVEMKTPGSHTQPKSPLWEPKLTPRRMGDDLYLSVSIATPQQAHFFDHMYDAR